MVNKWFAVWTCKVTNSIEGMQVALRRGEDVSRVHSGTSSLLGGDDNFSEQMLFSLGAGSV